MFFLLACAPTLVAPPEAVAPPPPLPLSADPPPAPPDPPPAPLAGAAMPPEAQPSTGDPMTDAVVDCYLAAIGRNPACRGTVLVTATVASDGSLLGTRLSHSTLNDPTADACIQAAVERFAKLSGIQSNGITTVQFPFTLSPG